MKVRVGYKYIDKSSPANSFTRNAPAFTRLYKNGYKRKRKTFCRTVGSIRVNKPAGVCPAFGYFCGANNVSGLDLPPPVSHE